MKYGRFINPHFINESSNSSYVGRDLAIEAKVEILAPYFIDFHINIWVSHFVQVKGIIFIFLIGR